MTRYQTLWRRFCAGLIDSLVFLPLSLADKLFYSSDRSAAAVIIWIGIGYSSFWLYSVLLHARYGQTVGKMAMKIKVLDVSEGRVPTLGQAFLRDSGYILLNALSLACLIYFAVTNQFGSATKYVDTLPGQILSWAGFAWFLLEIGSMMTNEKRRAIHDYIARTVVARNS